MQRSSSKKYQDPKVAEKKHLRLFAKGRRMKFKVSNNNNKLYKNQA